MGLAPLLVVLVLQGEMPWALAVFIFAGGIVSGPLKAFPNPSRPFPWSAKSSN